MSRPVPAQLSRIERPDPVSVEVARRLVDYLLSGEIGVGERIPSERQLATAFGVGRSAIRDALKPLQLLGLVEVRVGDGTYLAEADSAVLPRVIEWGLLLKRTRILELVESRGFVETALAALAAERRDAASLARMKQFLDRMVSSKTKRAFIDAYEAFQQEIGRAAKNTVLSGFLQTVESLRLIGIERVASTPEELERLKAEHVAIYAAIEMGDRAAVQEAMSKHIERVTALLRVALDKTR